MQVASYPDDPSSGRAGIDAAVAAINKEGGVGGRPIEVVYCDGGDVNKAGECARNAVEDDTILASVGNQVFVGGFTEIAADGGVPVLGLNAAGPGDLTCEICFTTSLNGFIVLGSAVMLSDTLGLDNVVLAVQDNAAGRGLGPFIDAILAPDAKLAATIPVSETASDLAPTIAALPPDTDGLNLAMAVDLGSRVAVQARRSGAEYPMASNTLVITPDTIEELIGDQAGDFYLASPFDLESPGYEAYQADIEAIGMTGTADDNGNALSNWLAIQLLRDTVEKIGPADVTRETIISTLQATSDYDTQGLTPPIDWTKPQTALGGTIPGLVSPNFVAYKYDPSAPSGLVPVGDGGFISIFDS